TATSASGVPTGTTRAITRRVRGKIPRVRPAGNCASSAADAPATPPTSAARPTAPRPRSTGSTTSPASGWSARWRSDRVGSEASEVAADPDACPFGASLAVRVNQDVVLLALLEERPNFLGLGVVVLDLRLDPQPQPLQLQPL